MIKRFSFYLLLPLLFVGFLLTSCGTDAEMRLRPTPGAFGSLGRLTVIADSTLWLDGAKDSVAYFFQSPVLILPQPEPIYDVRHIEPQRLAAQPAFRELRNYVILADLSDEDSPTTQMTLVDLDDAKERKVLEDGFGTFVARDRWANGQQLIYVVGRNQDELLDGLSSVYPAIVKRLAESERERYRATTYVQGIDRRLGDTLAEKTGLTLDVPGGFKTVPLEVDDFIWLRKDVKSGKGSINIMATRVPYEEDGQLSGEGLKAIRNELGRKYISSTLDSTYMVINDVDLPLILEQKNVNGAFVLEGRGIWEMENDFQGGPFISYLINDTTNRSLILVDGFILAPGERKRELMGQIESILASSRVR